MAEKEPYLVLRLLQGIKFEDQTDERDVPGDDFFGEDEKE